MKIQRGAMRSKRTFLNEIILISKFQARKFGFVFLMLQCGIFRGWRRYNRHFARPENAEGWSQFVRKTVRTTSFRTKVDRTAH